MNIQLLKGRDEQEWARHIDTFWSIALQAVSCKLFIPPYAQQDREDVAARVIREFYNIGIDRCDADDLQSVSRWIWPRAAWRAIDFRRRRRRERRGHEEQGIDTDQDGEGQRMGEGNHDDRPPEPQVEPVRVSLEELVNETIAGLRQQRTGFSRLDEAVFREILLFGKSPQDFAQDHGMPIGTLYRVISEVKSAIRPFLTGAE